MAVGLQSWLGECLAHDFSRHTTSEERATVSAFSCVVGIELPGEIALNSTYTHYLTAQVKHGSTSQQFRTLLPQTFGGR